MPGTSGNLECHDTIKLYECYYALMLPSGNDAAMTLAENLGLLWIDASSQISFAKIDSEGGTGMETFV